MLATLTREYFSDPNWIFEPKLDGVRCLAFKDGAGVRLMSRNQLDLTGAYPGVGRAIARQEPDFLLDGEIAAVTDGRTSFELLQQARRTNVSVQYFVFDIISHEGEDVTARDILERKALLKKTVSWRRPLRFVDHITGDGEAYLQAACEEGLEGLIAKRIGSHYVSGRSKDWLKFKCAREQEFVIAGYTDPQGTRVAFGALLIGYYEDGQLRYAGKVGTGFNEELLASLLKEMTPLEQGRLALRRATPCSLTGSLAEAPSRCPGRLLRVDVGRPPAAPAVCGAQAGQEAGRRAAGGLSSLE